MRIEGSLRSNLLAAIASAKRFRGRTVHKDTLEHWTQLLEYSERVSAQPSAEAVADLNAQLEKELSRAKTPNPR